MPTENERLVAALESLWWICNACNKPVSMLGSKTGAVARDVHSARCRGATYDIGIPPEN